MMKFIFFAIAIICVIYSCQQGDDDLENGALINDGIKDKDTVGQVFTKKYVPFYHLGDTVVSDAVTLKDTSTVVIDSNSLYSFGLTSRRVVGASLSTYFIKIIAVYENKIWFLDSMVNGGYVFEDPLLSTFQYKDSISYDYGEEKDLGWFPKHQGQEKSSGWIKYQVFEPNYSEDYTWELGENYVAIKFGEKDNEKVGWINVVYQGSICYVKEGFYCQESTQGIVIGDR